MFSCQFPWGRVMWVEWGLQRATYRLQNPVIVPPGKIHPSRGRSSNILFLSQLKSDGSYFCCQSIPVHHISANFCTCHHSCAVVTCAKFCGNYYIINGTKVKRCSHLISILSENQFVKWVMAVIRFLVHLTFDTLPDRNQLENCLGVVKILLNQFSVLCFGGYIWFDESVCKTNSQLFRFCTFRWCD